MQLSTNYRTRKQLEEVEGIRLPKYIMHPFDLRCVLCLCDLCV